MSDNPSVFMANNDQGVQRVMQGDYAYLMESASIEYIIERNCNLTQIGSLLDSKGYGIATRKGKFHSKFYLIRQLVFFQQSKYVIRGIFNNFAQILESNC